MKQWLRLLVLAAVLNASLAPVRAAERVATVELSGLIRQSIPALSPAQVSVAPLSTIAGTPSVSGVPAALDVTKAQVLMDRGGALAPLAAPEAKSEPQAAPQDVIRAVNSVLKDVSADKLKTMSDEDVHGISELILGQLAHPSGKIDSMAGLSVLARERLEKLKSIPYERKSLNAHHADMKEERIDIQGLPPGARLVPADGAVYRHYTDREGLQGIMSSGGVWNGYLSHINLTKHVSRETFVDLTGAFFTLPERDAEHEDVLAHESPYFVNVKLPKGLPLLETQAGKKFLIPLPARLYGWVSDAYDKWIKGESTPYASMAQKIDSEGGPGPKLRVPVEIVGHGLVGMNGTTQRFGAVEKRAEWVPAGVGAALDRPKLAAIVNAPKLDVDALFKELESDDFLRQQLKVPTVSEGYTGRQHAEAVVKGFESFYGGAKEIPLPTGAGRAFFRIVLALHDIGKARAFREGKLSQEHERTKEVLSVALHNLGYSPASIALANALIDGDPIGMFLKGGYDASAVKPASEFRRMAAAAGVPAADFFDLLTIFYRADAHAYTRWGGGIHSLDHLFDEAPGRKARDFSGYVKGRIAILRAAALAGSR